MRISWEHHMWRWNQPNIPSLSPFHHPICWYQPSPITPSWLAGKNIMVLVNIPCWKKGHPYPISWWIMVYCGYTIWWYTMDIPWLYYGYTRIYDDFTIPFVALFKNIAAATTGTGESFIVWCCVWCRSDFWLPILMFPGKTPQVKKRLLLRDPMRSKNLYILYAEELVKPSLFTSVLHENLIISIFGKHFFVTGWIPHL